MSFGYPGDNLHLENHGVSEESFWPSFTDIMMVIVMVFLLVTVTVILNNWTLIADLKESINAHKVASTLAENKEVENLELEAKLSYLEEELILFKNKTAAEQVKVAETQEKLGKSQKLVAELTALGKEQRALFEESEKSLAMAQVTIQEKNKQIAQITSQRDKTNASLENKLLALTLMRNNSKSLKAKLQLLSEEKQRIIAALNEKYSTSQKELSALRQKSSDAVAEVEEAKLQLSKMETKMAAVEKRAMDAEANLEIKDNTIVALQKFRQTSETQLLSLRGEYDTLDSKYQKLLRPARSSKGKYIVSISYKKTGGRRTIRLKSGPTADYKTLKRSEMEKVLTKLKKKYQNDLYVKIIIPENSGLSYNEAWRFTSDLQKKFDYYFQPDSKTDSKKANEAE